MRRKILGLDLDGTFTAHEYTMTAHLSAIMHGIANLIGEDGLQIMHQLEEEIRADPHQHGWRHGDKVVAPPQPNQLLMFAAIAEAALDRKGLFPDHTERHHHLGQIYRDAYLLPGAHFRPNAARALEAYAEISPHLHVVTNSVAGPAQDRLRRLQEEQNGDSRVFDRLVKSVRGSASKNKLVSDLDIVPEKWRVAGLSRPMYPRRGFYHSVLQSILDQHGATWTDLIVVGDVFELDLLYPFLRGASIAFMSDHNTPTYERELIDAHPERARMITDLMEVAQWR